MATENPVLEKYRAIIHDGMQAYRDGSVKPFGGFIGLENRYNISARFTPDSEKVLQSEVVEYLDGVGPAYGLVGLFVGNKPRTTFPFHSTVLEGRYNGVSEVEKDEIFRDVRKDPRLLEVMGLVSGTSIAFDHLLLAKESILVAASQIPASIQEAREILVEVYSVRGLEVLPMDNILHSTMVRILQIPRSDLRDQFIDIVMNLHSILQAKPIGVMTSRTFRGTAHQLLGHF